MGDVRIPSRRRRRQVYTVTDARRPMSEDIGHRERRYLLTMGIRAVCFVLGVVFAVTLHGDWRWLAIVALLGAVILPYIAVIFANGGREPDSSARFSPYEGSEGKKHTQNTLSGPRDEIAP